MAEPEKLLSFDSAVGLQRESPKEWTRKQRNAYHQKLLQTLADIEAEGHEMDRALAEIRRASHPEWGVPRPKAWAAIRRRHPGLNLPAEPNLTFEQKQALAEKLKAAGKLKRVRSEFWNPWAAQDEAWDEAAFEIHRTLSRAQEGEVGLEEWKIFRRKHRKLKLPKTPNLTWRQEFEILDKVRYRSFGPSRSLYSAIRW